MNAPQTPSPFRQLADLGFSIFPVERGGKRPLVKWERFQSERADPAQVDTWAGRDTNVGIATGAVSGLLVLDLDSEAAITEAEALGLPNTLTVRTGKGLHAYFQHPGGKVGNRAGLKPGWDIRGDGGYVVGPGSLHPSGKRYEWQNPPGLFELAPLPEWLAKMLAPPAEAKPTPASSAAPARRAAAAASASSECHPYALAALEGECEAIRKAGDGAQESTLNAAALKVGHYVGGGALAFDTARIRLLSAALAMPSYDPRNPWTANTLSAKIDRALWDGMADPKKVPERMTFAPQPRHDLDTGELLDDDPAPVREDWNDPVDLWANHGAPELPQGLLPSAIEVFARSHGDVMGVDPAGLAMACLAVCSAAITDEIQLQVKQHDSSWRESARLWVGLVGAPSMKKSPILSAAARPLKRLDLLRAGDRPLMLDANARAVRERLEAQHLALSCDLEGVSPKMAAHFGKHDGLFARLCVLWHCIDHGRGGLVPETISGVTAERVERFMVQFIRPSAVAFYVGLLGMSAGHEQLRDLAAWIVATGAETVRARDVQRAGQAFKHVTADDVRLICEKLEAFGWGCWGDPGAKSNRAPFIVNPRVHVLFVERGMAEAERRAKARELIRETVGA